MRRDETRRDEAERGGLSMIHSYLIRVTASARNMPALMKIPNGASGVSPSAIVSIPASGKENGEEVQSGSDQGTLVL